MAVEQIVCYRVLSWRVLGHRRHGDAAKRLRTESVVAILSVKHELEVCADPAGAMATTTPQPILLRGRHHVFKARPR
jgi:hypothetical protein